ncbi:MAG TPA: TetR/AcrR family transcriptional regulator [Terriglobales bacterium]|nr:TetR/AcrR family transcriptional regulator [Terriglobales bacterium]
MGTPHLRFSAEDRRNQILETATDLFARQGYEGTTTRQIAEKAHVNEAIIFRHFPSKDELYWAVIELQCKLGKGRQHVEDQLASSGDVREVFVEIATDFLGRRENDDRLGRLLLFSALENHRLSHRFFQTHIAEYYERLGVYIRERIEDGTFRSVNPLLAARAFMGMLVYHYMIQELFGGKKYHKMDNREVAEELVDIWLNGVVSQGRNSNGANGKSHAAKSGAAARKTERE